LNLKLDEDEDVVRFLDIYELVLDIFLII
jgi:hypothetical protein